MKTIILLLQIICFTYTVNAQYKIFLNDPDITVYPTGAFGSITGPITTDSHCDGNLDIFVPVNKTGKVDIFFNIKSRTINTTADTKILVIYIPVSPPNRKPAKAAVPTVNP